MFIPKCDNTGSNRKRKGAQVTCVTGRPLLEAVIDVQRTDTCEDMSLVLI